MTRGTWIVCESSSRWVAALRHALGISSADNGSTIPRIVETRKLAEASEVLRRIGEGFVAVEVRHDNLVDALRWLADTRRQFPRARCVALLDRLVQTSAEDHDGPDDHVHSVVNAVREAGALEIARSPRSLQSVIQLAERHVETQVSAATQADLPFIQQVWASLPWQGE